MIFFWKSRPWRRNGRGTRLVENVTRTLGVSPIPTTRAGGTIWPFPTELADQGGLHALQARLAVGVREHSLLEEGALKTYTIWRTATVRQYKIVRGENEDDAPEKSWRQPWIEAKVIDSQPSTPKISSSIMRRGTNPAEGSRGNSRVAPASPGGPMNDNGALAAIIIAQWVTILLLALILWRIW